MGSNFSPPYWPESNLTRDQREGNRQEVYTIYFDSDGTNYTYNADDQSEFEQYQPDSDWILKVNTFGNVNEVVAP